MEYLYSLWDWISEALQSLGLKNKKANIILLGLDNAGKTTLMRILVDGTLKQYPPTLYPTKEEYTLAKIKFCCFDMGGHPEGRLLWTQYFPVVDAICFIVDAADTSRLEEARGVLQGVLTHEYLKDTPVLILGNKVDKHFATSEEQLRHALGIQAYSTGKTASVPPGVRPLELFMCSVVERFGYPTGFQWLANYL